MRRYITVKFYAKVIIPCEVAIHTLKIEVLPISYLCNLK